VGEHQCLVVPHVRVREALAADVGTAHTIRVEHCDLEARMAQLLHASIERGKLVDDLGACAAGPVHEGADRVIEPRGRDLQLVYGSSPCLKKSCKFTR
jgi:hypothetical protein